MKKRQLLLGLVLIIFVGVFSGCQNKEAENKNTISLSNIQEKKNETSAQKDVSVIDIKGKWNIRAETGGSMKMMLDLKQDGNKITGDLILRLIAGPKFNEKIIPLEESVLNGNILQLIVMLEDKKFVFDMKINEDHEMFGTRSNFDGTFTKIYVHRIEEK